MDEKFAVYVVMVEDSAEADMDVSAASHVMKRIAGNLTYAEAEGVTDGVATVNSDMYIDAPQWAQ